MMISDVSDQDITMQSSTKGRRKRPRWMDVFWHQDFFSLTLLQCPYLPKLFSYHAADHEMQLLSML